MPQAKHRCLYEGMIGINHTSYTDWRQNFVRYLDEIFDSGSPIIVTRQGKRDVVLMSAEEHAGMEETLHLLRSPANAKRLLRSVRAAEAGLVSEQELCLPEHPVAT